MCFYIDQYAADQYDDIGDEGSYVDGPGFELPDSTDNSSNGNFVDSDDYVVRDIEGIRKVEKVRVSHANVAKKVDVKRLKKELWAEVETQTTRTIQKNEQESLDENSVVPDINSKENQDEFSSNAKMGGNESEEIDLNEGHLSFKETVFKMEATEAQEDVSLAFYFICMLHLANEKDLKLENGEHGLNDFIISKDDTNVTSVGKSSRSLMPKPPSVREMESDCESDSE